LFVLALCHGFGHTEIQHRHVDASVRLARDHDVFEFEVAVDDLVVVRFRKSAGDFFEDFDDLEQRQGATLECVSKGRTVDVLHDDV